MPLPPDLVALRHRLQEIGMVVVEEPTHVIVRLPYFCSVRIYSTDGRLRFEPYLGMIPRTRATMTKLLMFTGFAIAAFKGGVPWALGVAMVGIMAGIYDVIRVLVTENVITRASAVYSGLVHGRADTPPAHIGQPTRVLAAPPPASEPPPVSSGARTAPIRRDS